MAKLLLLDKGLTDWFVRDWQKEKERNGTGTGSTVYDACL
jgi:hypothetical protein